MAADGPQRAEPMQVGQFHSDESFTLAYQDAAALRGRFLGDLLACDLWRQLSGSQQGVVGALAFFINCNEVTVRGGLPIVSPSLREIMDKSGCGEVSARRGIDELVRLGVATLAREGVGQTSSVYVLHFVADGRAVVAGNDQTKAARRVAAETYDSGSDPSPSKDDAANRDNLRGIKNDTSEVSESAPQRRAFKPLSGALFDTSEGSKCAPLRGQNARLSGAQNAETVGPHNKEFLSSSSSSSEEEERKRLAVMGELAQCGLPRSVLDEILAGPELELRVVVAARLDCQANARRNDGIFPVGLFRACLAFPAKISDQFFRQADRALAARPAAPQPDADRASRLGFESRIDAAIQAMTVEEIADVRRQAIERAVTPSAKKNLQDCDPRQHPMFRLIVRMRLEKVQAAQST